MNKRDFILAVFAVLGMVFCASAQMKVGDNPTIINANSVLETETTNKGMLLPRIALTATNNVAPLTAHVAGMVVYNTATAGTGTNAIVPGYYYNNGSGWLKIAQEGSVNLASLSLTNSTTPAGNMGQVAYNTNAASGLPVGPVYWNGTNWIPISSTFGTVTNVTGTAPISITTGTTTPVISLDDAGITTAKLADNAVATAKIADASITTAKLAAGVGGIYKGSGSLSGATIVTQGADALTFDGAGNFIKTGTGFVGIGRPVPTQRLHIDDGKLAVGASTPGTWSTNGSDIILNTGVANSTIYLRPNGDGSTENQFLTTPASGHSFFGSDGLEKVRIMPSGNVGIGTTSPAAKLDVNGATALRGQISTSESLELSNLGTGDRNSFIDFHSQDAVDYSARIMREPGANGLFNLINGSALMSLNTIGNVGIGTTSPAAKLDVNGQVKISGGTPGVGKILTSDAAGLATWETPTVPTGSVTSVSIVDGSITTADLADGAVTSAKIADGTIATADIADGAITGAKIADNVALPGTGSMVLPSGTTAQRPATATAGMSRYNTTTNVMEYYNGTAWVVLTESVTPDGSETKVTAGANVAVTGAGTTASPYVVATNSSIVVATADLTATAANSTILCNVPVAGMTLTLPAAAANTGKILVIRKVDNDADVLTFSPAINYSTTETITTLNYVKTLTVQSDGTNWWVISE